MGMFGKQKFYEDPGKIIYCDLREAVSVASFQSPVIPQKPPFSCIQSSGALQRPLAANCSAVSCAGLCRGGKGSLALPGCCGVAFLRCDSPILNTQPPVCLD